MSSIQVEDRDKSIIRNIVTKPWNLYVWRHLALTKKSQFLTEANLRSHAGWTASNKMPQVYVHLSGESNNAILEKYGIITRETKEKENSLKGIECPNCNERCKPNSKFCGTCRMVLTYDSYSEVRNEDKQKISNLETDIESPYTPSCWLL